MSRKWVISDTHFYHDRVITYEKRPFADIDEMNCQIIKRWNQVVSKRDKVFHLGDFSFGNKCQVADIVGQLKGDIYLILGNHDRSRSDAWWLETGIKTVYRYPIIMNNYFILSHEVTRLNSYMPYINLHGHTHGKCMEGFQYINCSVEVNNYAPQNLDAVLTRYKSLYEVEDN